MGRFYTNAIMYGLKGRTLDGQPYDEKAKPHDGKRKSRMETELVFLLTIAARQPDPGSKDGELDPICWGDRETLRAIMHLGVGTFHTCRNKLVDAGILSFSPREGKYTNVYRINLKYLRRFYPDVKVWRNEVLKINPNENLSEGVLRTLEVTSGICTKNPEVLNSNSEVLNLNSEVLNLNTNIKKHKDNTHATDVDAVFLESIVLEIANVLRVDPMAINRKPLAKAIAGKFPDSVRRTINQPPGWVLKDSTTNKVGALIGVLSKLPAEKDDPAFRAKKPQTIRDYLSQISSPAVRSLTEKACAAVGCDEADQARQIGLFIENRLNHAADERQTRRALADAISGFSRTAGETAADSVARFISSLPKV